MADGQEGAPRGRREHRGKGHVACSCGLSWVSGTELVRRQRWEATASPIALVLELSALLGTVSYTLSPSATPPKCLILAEEAEGKGGQEDVITFLWAGRYL